MCKLIKPSAEKPWLKYFSEEARGASVPQNTIYRHLRENNENGRGDTALNYFGRKISYGMLLDEADRAAGLSRQPVLKRRYSRRGDRNDSRDGICAVRPQQDRSSSAIIDPRTSAAGAMSFIKETGAKIL